MEGAIFQSIMKKNYRHINLGGDSFGSTIMDDER
jgi:hypothetical protein